MMFLFLIFCLDANTAFETKTTLQPISDVSNLFLQSVDDIAIGTDGRIYILDENAVRIHVWDAEGRYLTSFGKKGQGPGEFTFQGNSDALSLFGDALYVFDSGAGKISVFDLEGTYRTSFNLEVGRGLVPLFAVVAPETLLINNASWFADTPYRRLATYDTGGKLRDTLVEIEDTTWRYTSENGQQRVTLLAYATTLMTAFDETRGEVLSGDNASNRVRVTDLEGNLLRELELDLVRRDLTREIREAWQNQPWFQQQNFYKVAFPDELPVYNRVVPFAEGFVFFVQLTPDNACEGIVTDRNGKTVRRFETGFGSSGGLYGANGKLLTVRADDMGDLTVALVSAQEPPGSR